MSEEVSQAAESVAQDIDVPTGGDVGSSGASDGAPSPDSGGEGGLDAGGDAESKGLLERMWNTEPNPPLDAVESPWQPDSGGLTRVFRGVQKVGDVQGLPAILDITIGLLEFGMSDDFDLGSGSGSGEQEEEQENQQSVLEQAEVA